MAKNKKAAEGAEAETPKAEAAAEAAPAEKPAKGAKAPKVKGEKAAKAPKEAPAEAVAAEAAPRVEKKPAKVIEPRLSARYRSEVRKLLKERFGYGNDMAVPRLTKIVISMGVGKALQNPKRIEEAQKHLTALAGQKAVVTKAKEAVSNFRLRIGNAIGCRVTLRRQMMYEFLDRLITVAIPRIRDFRGLSDRSFDGKGNYTFGLSEQTVFLEVDADRMEFTQGMNITLCTSAATDKEAYELLAGFGFPFRKN